MKRFSSGGCYADITPKERAIANGQRSFVSFLLLQLSNTFLRILAVPNKAVFCNSPILIVTPSFSSHASNLMVYSLLLLLFLLLLLLLLLLLFSIQCYSMEPNRWDFNEVWNWSTGEKKKNTERRATKTWPMHQSKGEPLRQPDFSKVNLPPQEVRQ